MTAMHHEPVADRLGVPRHQLPADWRQRGGSGGGGGGGRNPGSRDTGGGCAAAILVALILLTGLCLWGGHAIGWWSS